MESTGIISLAPAQCPYIPPLAILSTKVPQFLITISGKVPQDQPPIQLEFSINYHTEV